MTPKLASKAKPKAKSAKAPRAKTGPNKGQSYINEIRKDLANYEVDGLAGDVRREMEGLARQAGDYVRQNGNILDSELLTQFIRLLARNRALAAIGQSAPESDGDYKEALKEVVEQLSKLRSNINGMLIVLGGDVALKTDSTHITGGKFQLSRE